LSIFDETGGGLAAVAHDRSLELFFDRYEVIARFVADQRRSGAAATAVLAWAGG
jgi:hypothetical protein